MEKSDTPSAHKNMIANLKPSHQLADMDMESFEQYVTLSVHGDEYGVHILSIQEIKAWSETTPLPNSPEFMRGVLNLRGLIVPIYDLKCRFGKGLSDVSPVHVIIIVKINDRLAGMLVDAVSDIINLSEDHIQPLPELDHNVDSAFISGIANMDGRIIAILDLENLFARTPEALNKEIAPDQKQMITDENLDGENA